MRAGIVDPVENTAHDSKYSPLNDRNDISSAKLCGSCHDIVTPKGVHLERTYKEWQSTLFSRDTPSEKLTCSGCHMPGRNAVAADYEGVLQRRIHDHAMPGVDVALTDFFEIDAQRALVQSELDNTLLAQLCVYSSTTGANIDFTLENVAAGHAWPSGAAHDRRVWVEINAYQGDRLLFTSGVLPDGMALTELNDPQLWRLGDFGFDSKNEPAHFFWDIERIESEQLPGQPARKPTDPGWINTHITRRYTLASRPDRVTAKVHVRPVGLDVLSDLVESDDLAAEIIQRMPTFTLNNSALDWQADGIFPCVPNR